MFWLRSGMKNNKSIITALLASVVFCFSTMELQAKTKYGMVSEGESCLATRQERQKHCNQAAVNCLEVEELTAFNKIRPCAHHSQQCALLGQEEEKYCFGDPNSRVSMRSSSEKSNE